MRILIIGSGLIGVTTAYSLRRRGHEVMVIDRQAGAGREASFANGGLLTPSMADPWNAPGSWRLLLASLGRSDGAMQLHLRALPALWHWGIAFLCNSRTAAFERNVRSNLRLALYSLEVMQRLRRQTGIEYDRVARGSLRIFRDQGALEQASAAADRLSSAGLRCRRLSPAALMAFEPSLTPIVRHLTGAIHYESDETGDAHRFCVALADHAKRQGVDFRFLTEVESLEMRSGRVVAVVSGQDRFEADCYIVAAGCFTAPLIRLLGIRLPVQPVKGYSATLDYPSGPQALRTPIVDDKLHAVVVPFAGAIRVAGTAEFAGYDSSPNAKRIHNLLGMLREILPDEPFNTAAARSWCGLRAMSADGVAIIGPTPVPNLMVNTGHGHLGWTMAAGSADLLADLIDGRPTSIDSKPYDARRSA